MFRTTRAAEKCCASGNELQTALSVVKAAAAYEAAISAYESAKAEWVKQSELVDRLSKDRDAKAAAMESAEADLLSLCGKPKKGLKS